jgi:AAA15 family ATPase/GTPase
MLVQFLLKNVLSFKEETILDMTAIAAYKEHACNCIALGNKEKYLKVASIYGANASGKSNLLLAIFYFQRIIAESFNNTNEKGNTTLQEYFVPFLLDSVYENSEFQIVMIKGDYEYRYGFSYNATWIASEWLYRKNLNTKRTSVIFERTTKKVEFGPSVRKECEVYKKQIPSDTLVLSFFNKLKLNVDVFNIMYSEVMDMVFVPMDSNEDERMIRKYLPSIIDQEKEKLMEFLAAIDTGIKDIVYEKGKKEMIFSTIHMGRDGESYFLNLFHESDGTIKSVLLFLYVYMARKCNFTIFIDELNGKLHPLLVKFIVDLFYEEESEAQLIYTTHDTTLMDKKFFRRDQIWFVQKDEFGYSELSALSDFKVRSDASFEKDYLAGVYGGIPLLKEFHMKEGTYGFR